ncbi:SusC/RagA family TonB-linked outer membrane protein [Chitinophaga qingshengii]|uniref:SusC/RagA family TonB-linked outer membrane protein n=1 Tax=Chitinophaga qingshengii TaxID=1569794 RepID=A0ABR7TSA8_9BACT|nr:SusC/RagA family TonB-linked outer membrane protein [Chitinophaga qingshengii]MBC9932883.1 SusC/RagA family TonB-linked outer membrane protein [Chitinophaga qingshengii]
MHLPHCRLSLWTTISRTIALTVMTALILTTTHLSAQERKNVAIEKVPAEKAFKQLEAIFQVRFFYSGSSIDKQENISIPPAVRTLEDVLQYLADRYRYAFRQQDNMISVSLRPAAPKEPIIQGRIGLYEGDNIAYNPGITVREENNRNAAITDAKGYFTLKLSQPNSRIHISCVGYEHQELDVNANTMVNLTLQPSLKSIPEVVISTGYQNLARKNTTGAYGAISSREVERRSSQSITSVLEGSVPGLTLASGYDRVNGVRRPTGINLQVRGGSSIGTDRTAPLIILDGFPVNQLPDNLNDVEKIDVLKDAAAAAVWGASASNGVVVITTKRGKEGKMRVNYATNVYFTQRPDYSRLDRANARDLVDFDKESYDKGFIDRMYFDNQSNGYSPSYDLLFRLKSGEITQQEFARKQDSLGSLSNMSQVRDLLMRTGLRQNHFLSLSGGSGKYRFMVSGSYDHNQATYIADKSNLFQLNMRNDLEVNSRLRFSVDMNGTFQDNQTGPTLNSGILQTPPYQLLVDPNGKYLYDYTGFNKMENDRLLSKGYLDNGRNLLEEARLANNSQKKFGLRTKVGGEWKIIKGLTLNADFLYDKMKQNGKNLGDEQSYDTRSFVNRYASVDGAGNAVFNIPKGAILRTSETTFSNWAVRGQLNYTNVFRSVHFLNLAAGTETKKYITEGLNAAKFGYDDALLIFKPVDQNMLLKNTLKWWNGSSLPSFDVLGYDGFDFNDERQQSFYGMATYTYDDRYTLTGSYRVDKSNLFGVDPKYRNNPLWSAGGAWDIAREKFFRWEKISLLKLRTSIGLTGNFDRTTTPLLVATKRFQGVTGDYNARVDSYNPKLRWERTRTLNMGLDLGMFDNRLQITADVYRKYGYGLLGTTILDPTVGMANMKINAAKMRNNGIELAIQATVLDIRSFKWTSRLNAAYNHNIIVENKIPDSAPERNRVSGTTQFVEGYSRESVWSYRWAGLDSKGNPTVYGDKDEKVKVPVFSSVVNSGTYRAPYSGGFTNIFYYKNFFASVMTIFNFGNVLRREMPSMNALEFSNAMNYQIRNRWRKPGDEAFTDIAAMTQSFNPDDFYDGRENAMRYSTNSIISGDYIRLREIQLGYDFPAKMLKGSFLKGVHIIGQMNNVALWKKNKYGIDPEAIDPITGAYYLPEPRVTTLTVRVEL